MVTLVQLREGDLLGLRECVVITVSLAALPLICFIPSTLLTIGFSIACLWGGVYVG